MFQSKDIYGTLSAKYEIELARSAFKNGTLEKMMYVCACDGKRLLSRVFLEM